MDAIPHGCDLTGCAMMAETLTMALRGHLHTPQQVEPAALNGRHGLQGRFTNTNWNQSHEVSYDRAGCNAG